MLLAVSQRGGARESTAMRALGDLSPDYTDREFA
jgi:hypothetical protein